MNSGNESIVVECSVRTPLIFEPVDDHVATLRELQTDGVIDDVVFRSWPDEVRLDGDEPVHEAVDRYEQFRQWAAREGVSVRPPFETWARTSLISEKDHELLVTPLCCLAVYHEERLVGVYPHSRDDETYTAERAVKELRAGELPGTLARAVLDPECPDCGGSLDSGQGLYACAGCGWVGTKSDGEYERLQVTQTGERATSSHRDDAGVALD